MAGEGEQIIELKLFDETAEEVVGKKATTFDWLLMKYPWLQSMVETPAVLTGSNAYGHPRPDSDVDLVIYVPEEALRVLEAIADPDPKWDDKADTAERDGYEAQRYERLFGRSKPLRFGRLNLVCTTNRSIYEAWRQGTKYLVEKSKVGTDVVSRDEAKRVLKELRAKVYGGGS